MQDNIDFAPHSEPIKQDSNIIIIIIIISKIAQRYFHKVSNGC